MTGRELIIYILENHLEDEPIFENGQIVGFMSLTEAACKFDVGAETIRVWINQGRLDAINVHNEIYIPFNAAVKEV